MIYRRKLVLAVLEQSGNATSYSRIQRFFSGFSQRQIKPIYDFIPVQGENYSFQLQMDLEMLAREGMIHTNAGICEKITGEKYLPQLKSADLKLLDQVNEKQIVHPIKQVDEEIAALFTIGYKGISLEKYLRRLLEQRITVLCDVRKNAFSMKFGFSKHQLRPACEAVGIRYEHLPELGINSDLRKGISEGEKSILFRDYETRTLPENMAAVKAVLKLLRSDERIALTCFEADACQCHRRPLAALVEKLSAGVYPATHL